MAASSGSPFLKIGQVIALRQFWETCPLQRDLLHRAVIGSGRKSARICNMKGWRSSGPEPFAVSNVESSLFTAADVKRLKTNPHVFHYQKDWKVKECPLPCNSNLQIILMLFTSTSVHEKAIFIHILRKFSVQMYNSQGCHLWVGLKLPMILTGVFLKCSVIHNGKEAQTLLVLWLSYVPGGRSQ